jgi:ankyrin repeat protein
MNNRLGYTPLLEAVANNHLEMVKHLLTHGADINDQIHMYTPLILAIRKSHDEIAEYLIAQGADLGEICETKGYTPIAYAVEQGNLRLVKKLIEAGVLIDEEDSMEHTPLTRAVWMGNLEMVKLLIDLGADIEGRCRRGWTPLLWAIHKDTDVHIVKYLIKKGAKLDVLDEDGDKGKLPIVNAQNPKIVKCLIKGGASVWGTVNHCDDSAVFKACMDGNYKKVKYLVRAGAVLYKGEVDEILSRYEKETTKREATKREATNPFISYNRRRIADLISKNF